MVRKRSNDEGAPVEMISNGDTDEGILLMPHYTKTDQRDAYGRTVSAPFPLITVLLLANIADFLFCGPRQGDVPVPTLRPGQERN